MVKDNNVLKMDKVSVDPLSAFSGGNEESEEWSSYYKDLELTNFIKGDLDRLYMNGIIEDYFETKTRRNILLTVLFVWSQRNPIISYRQGMHEIAGIILYTLEKEREGWSTQSLSHPLTKCFTEENLEAHLFWLFNRIMEELVVLYDPTPTHGRSGSNNPPIVHFCTRVQEHFLSQLDPDLCMHLESCSIPGQLYGMRWCRLLFSREFPVTHTHCLKIWDYIFACCFEPKNNQQEQENADEDAMTLAMVLKARYQPYTPMLAAIGDFMISLLLQVFYLNLGITPVISHRNCIECVHYHVLVHHLYRHDENDYFMLFEYTSDSYSMTSYLRFGKIL